MIPVMAGNLKLGSGRVKICVPIAYEDRESILAEAERIGVAPEADIAEWRIDWYEQVFDSAALCSLARELKGRLKEKPLLITFRSRQEGGQRDCTPEEYERLLTALIELRLPKLLDVELGMGADCAGRLVRTAHSTGLPVIMSMHDFQKTPAAKELLTAMERMVKLGADICKTAVMPRSISDVAELLRVTAMMKERHPDIPLVTMSMGKQGMISRICGGFFGSVMTFGSLGRASAPGQVAGSELKKLLDILEQYR